MRNAGLDEAQAGIKIAGRNINNLRYVADTTLKTETTQEWKSLLMKVKEESENVASWPAYKFLRRQVRWSGIPISLRIFHSLLCFDLLYHY